MISLSKKGHTFHQSTAMTQIAMLAFIRASCTRSAQIVLQLANITTQPQTNYIIAQTMLHKISVIITWSINWKWYLQLRKHIANEIWITNAKKDETVICLWGLLFCIMFTYGYSKLYAYISMCRYIVSLSSSLFFIASQLAKTWTVRDATWTEIYS